MPIRSAHRYYVHPRDEEISGHQRRNRENQRLLYGGKDMKWAVALGLLLTGCSHLNSVSLTQIPSNRTQVVEAARSRYIFMAFNFNNDYVDELADDLRSRCVGGVVSGILTKDETVIYFPGLFWKRAVIARGYCNR